MGIHTRSYIKLAIWKLLTNPLNPLSPKSILKPIFSDFKLQRSIRSLANLLMDFAYKIMNAAAVV